MTVICAILLYRLGHPKKNYKHTQVREKDKKNKFQCNSVRLYIQMNTNAESISNVSVIKDKTNSGVTCILLPNMGAALALPINHGH